MVKINDINHATLNELTFTESSVITLITGIDDVLIFVISNLLLCPHWL